MEVVANRNYFKSKTGDIRIRIRAFDDNVVKAINLNSELCKSLLEPCVKFAKKPDLKDDSELVLKYNFVEMPYDNRHGKDRMCHHAVIIVNSHDNAKQVIDLLSKSKLSISSRKVNDKSYTVSLGFPNTVSGRGFWRDIDGFKCDVKFPICVISFKRANDSCGLSHLTLCRMKLKHFIFVEPFEFDDYVKWADPTYATIISSGEDFSVTKNMGSTPMRNFALDWGLDKGFERIWMLDDNICFYQRFHESIKSRIESSQIFSSVEKYVDRFNNVGIVSHNFSPLVREGDMRSVIVKNGKCYSSLLIPTFADIRFRYRHQEDNLISIEYIQKGFCTLCFNHIQYSKHTSGTDKGGNRESLYKCEGKSTEGLGYKERYEYFENVLNSLHAKGELPLKPEFKSIGVSAFLSRSTNINSKEYHARCEYKTLVQNECELKDKPEKHVDDDNLILDIISSSSVCSDSPVVSVSAKSDDCDGEDYSCSSCAKYKARIAELEFKFAQLKNILSQN